jgi:hypothetical protein
MKVYCVISIARQVDGEYCLVRTEKAFTKQESADAFSKGLSKKYAEVIQTPNGSVNCVCERGVFEIDVED